MTTLFAKSVTFILPSFKAKKLYVDIGWKKCKLFKTKIDKKLKQKFIAKKIIFESFKVKKCLFNHVPIRYYKNKYVTNTM